MKPHPAFADASIPERHRLGPFLLRRLGVEDLDEDMAAIRESESCLAGLSDGGWPLGLTREADLIDLAWHQREFEARRSFAWVIADASSDAYLGCAYVYTAFDPVGPLDAWWWFRDAARGRPEVSGFGDLFERWLKSPPWPALPILMRPPPG
ncbi:MAG: hypothetical protein AAF676_14985 [Pseudomonadota bacterium]